MGNCCLPSGQMLISVRKNGKEHEQLVCSRCHRPNHSRKECYASTYSDDVYDKTYMSQIWTIP